MHTRRKAWQLRGAGGRIKSCECLRALLTGHVKSQAAMQAEIGGHLARLTMLPVQDGGFSQVDETCAGSRASMNPDGSVSALVTLAAWFRQPSCGSGFPMTLGCPQQYACLGLYSRLNDPPHARSFLTPVFTKTANYTIARSCEGVFTRLRGSSLC